MFRTIPRLVNRYYRRNPVTVSPALVPSIKPSSLFRATESVSSFTTSSAASIRPPNSPLRRFLKFLSLGALDELDDRTLEFRKFALQPKEGRESSISSPMADGDGQPFKRPGLDAFLECVSEMGYEVVLYTHELNLGVSDLIGRLKNGGYFFAALTRGSAVKQDGRCYQDLSKLNRDPSRILYVSGHALENCLQPENCILIKPWKKEADDTALADLQPFLEYVAYERPDDIRQVLSPFNSIGNDTSKLRSPSLSSA